MGRDHGVVKDSQPSCFCPIAPEKWFRDKVHLIRFAQPGNLGIARRKNATQISLNKKGNLLTQVTGKFEYKFRSFREFWMLVLKHHPGFPHLFLFLFALYVSTYLFPGGPLGPAISLWLKGGGTISSVRLH